MPVTNCTARSTASTGSALIAKQEAQHHIQDYDALQGYTCNLVFFPMRANRLFPNVPLFFDLDNRFLNQKITAIELFDGTQLASYAGVDLPSSFVSGWIVLKDECNNTLAELPLSKLNRVTNGGKNAFFRKLPVDWGKSFLRLTDVTGLSNAGFLFNVWTTPN